MVEMVRIAEQSLGKVEYGGTESEEKSKVFRRSIFVVEDIKDGDVFSKRNVRSIRPGYGLPPRYLESVIGRVAVCNLYRGSPLRFEHVQGME